MKSIYKKTIKTQYLYKVEKLTIFYNYKIIELITNVIVLISKVIKIHYILYSKKRNWQSKYIK